MLVMVGALVVSVEVVDVTVGACGLSRCSSGGWLCC